MLQHFTSRRHYFPFALSSSAHRNNVATITIGLSSSSSAAPRPPRILRIRGGPNSGPLTELLSGPNRGEILTFVVQLLNFFCTVVVTTVKSTVTSKEEEEECQALFYSG